MRLGPSARAALGKVSPELAWLWVNDMVYHAADQYQAEALALADKLNLDMDFASLDVVLAEMNPIQVINELHCTNPSLSLQNLIKQPPLKVSESVIQMALNSDCDRDTMDSETDSMLPTVSLPTASWENPNTPQSRADQFARYWENAKASLTQAIKKNLSNSNTPAQTPAAVSSTGTPSTAPTAPPWEVADRQRGLLRKDLARAEREKRWEDEQQEMLAALPETEDAEFALTWEFEVGEPNNSWLTKHGQTVIHRQRAYFEDYRIFERAARTLKERYGNRLKDLIPSLEDGTGTFLYGDYLGSIGRVQAAREMVRARVGI